MAEPKTKKTAQTPEEFIATVEPETKRNDALVLLEMFKRATGEKAVMWGSSIIGFGDYHYKSERSAQEGDWFLVGFSPRKANLTLYIMGHYTIGGVTEKEELFKKLGKYKTSGGDSSGCLYINKLSDVDQDILETLIKKAYLDKKKSLNK